MRTTCSKEKLPVADDDGTSMTAALQENIDAGEQGLAEARFRLTLSLIKNKNKLLNHELLPASVDLPFRCVCVCQMYV